MKRIGTPRWVVPALLVLFVILVTSAAARKSATYDESVHLYSGWRILTAGDFTTNHEHPPLMKVLAAIPLMFMHVEPPRSQVHREVDEWNVAHDFVYHANDGDRLLAAARFPITLLGALLGWVLFRYARAPWGAALGSLGALTATALLVFEPNVLAHSGLVTTDLGMTAMSFFSFASFVRAMRDGSRNRTVAAGVLFGLALLTKFTAVLLAPILVVTGAVIVALEESVTWRHLVRTLAIVGVVGLFVLNLGYGFGGTFSSLRDFKPESRVFAEYAAGRLGGVPLPVPVEYVRGFDHAEAGGQRWWAYLFGQHSMTGWRSYYLTALAVKTPLPLLLLAAAGLLFWPLATGGAGGRSAGEETPMRPLDAILPQVPLLCFLAAFTLASNLKNIGLRYILQVYPFLCLIAAIPTRIRPPAAWRRGVVTALVVWQVGAALWIYPDFLTFFNLAAGGPSNGKEVLLDSNLDWGQDLKGLGRWIRQHHIESIYVDYFGRGCLTYYGVKSTPDFEGGWIAVSATNLKGVYSQDRDRYRFLEGVRPEAVIGRSIFIYNVPRPPDWKTPPGRGGGS